MFPRFALNMNNFEVRNGEVTIVGETKGTGPHVVCITGWANNRDVWSGLSENLCKDHQVTTWDLRGHGESGAPPPGNYEREEALKDISAVLDEVGRPCVLVGHSLGGYLSLAYALERPDEVSAGPGSNRGVGHHRRSDRAAAVGAPAPIVSCRQRIFGYMKFVRVLNFERGVIVENRKLGGER